MPVRPPAWASTRTIAGEAPSTGPPHGRGPRPARSRSSPIPACRPPPASRWGSWWRRRRGARPRRPPPRLRPSPVRELLELALERLAHDLPRGRLALADRLGELRRLLEPDVRRKRRHLGIGDRLDQHGLASRERVVPSRADLLRRVDADGLEAQQLRVARVGKVG